MTLSDGNVLAKVKKDQNGKWQIVGGEIAIVFEVLGNPTNWTSDAGSFRTIVSLRELE